MPSAGGLVALEPSEQEKWYWDNGVISCTYGSWQPKQFTYNVASRQFDSPSSSELGKGTWNEASKKIDWNYGGLKFYEFSIIENGTRTTFRNTQQAFGPTADWVYDKASGKLEVQDKTNAPEGTVHAWDVQGDIPLPLAFFIGLFTRTQNLKKKYDEKMNRSYKRCNKFAGALSTSSPFLCSSCASKGHCVTCSKPQDNVPGKFCKACAPRTNLCAKCGDACGVNKMPGFLCNSCGIGKQKEDCCRMLY